MFAQTDTANDPTAQIRQWTQWHRGNGGMSATQARKWDFGYDAVDQLLEAVKAPVADGSVESRRAIARKSWRTEWPRISW